MIQPRLKKKYLKKAHHLIRRSKKSQKLQANVEPFPHHRLASGSEANHHHSAPLLERSNSDPTQAFFTPPKQHCNHQPVYVNPKVLHSHQGVYPLCEVTPISSKTGLTVKQYRPPSLSMGDDSLRTFGPSLTSTPAGRTPVARQIAKPHSDLAAQLKVQLEVNRELKRLLIASVGNDLQQRFEQIVHEKASLSRGLDASLKQLADNNEEFDRVSIECDIWRSKYLASRLMIDELASWKAELSLQFKESQKALRSLLAERGELCEELVQCHTHLCQILEHLQLSKGSENMALRNGTLISKGIQDGRVATVPPMTCAQREKPSYATSVYHPSSTASLQSRFTVLDLARSNTSVAKSVSSSLPEVTRGTLRVEEEEKPLGHHVVTEPTTGEKIASQVLRRTRGRTLHEQSLPLPMRLNEEELLRQRTQSPRLTSTSFSSYNSFVDDPYGIPFHCMNCKGRVIVV